MAIGIHNRRGAYQGRAVEGQFRATHVFTRKGTGDTARWRFVSQHLSPMAQAPARPRPSRPAAGALAPDRQCPVIAAAQVAHRPHPPGRTQVGPPPHVATAVAALAVIATGVVSLVAGGASPFGLPATVAGHHGAEVLAAICLIVAATGLAFGSAVISARLSFLAPNAPGSGDRRGGAALRAAGCWR